MLSSLFWDPTHFQARHHYLVLPKENIPDLKRLRSEHTKLVQHMQEEAKRYVDNQHAGIEFRWMWITG